MQNINSLKFKDLIKILFLYILLFFLFYFEPIHIAGIKFAVLWKLPLVALLIGYTMITVLKTRALPIFVLFGLLLSLKYFFTLSSFQYMSTTIGEFIKFSIFFLLFLFLQKKYTKKILVKMGNHLSVFIIISFIPFMLGLLKPLGRSMDISNYGSTTGNSLTGIFQNPHAAGIVLAFALLIVFYNFLHEVNYKAKIFLLLLLLLGLVELPMIMVRTSIVMFVLGALYISLQNFKFKHYVLFTLIAFISFGYISLNYKQSPLLQSMIIRFQGDTKYQDNKTVGSGRVMFAKIALDSWQSEGPIGVVFGLGMELGKDKMYEAMGQRLFAHNGFVQILQSEGLVGIILYILFLYFLFRHIIIYKKNKYYTLLVGLYISYIIAIYFQGGDYFLLYVLFSIYLAILTKNNEKIQNISLKESNGILD